MKNKSNHKLLSAGFLTLALTAGGATAQTWDGGGTDESWGTANNWNPNGTPAFNNTTDIVFYSSATKLTNFLGLARTMRSLTFNADVDSTVTIRMQSILANTGGVRRDLTLASDTGTSTVTVESGSTGNVTFTSGYGGQIRINNDLVIDHNGSGNLFFRNFNDTNVTEGPFPTVTKNGSGTWQVGGASSLRGEVVVNAGTLGLGGVVAPSGNLFRGSVTVSGGILDLVSYDQAVENDGTVTLQSGTITGTTASLSSTVAFDMWSGTVNAILAGSGGLTKTTGGTVTLNNANTYTGSTSIQVGTLALGSSGAIAGSSIDVQSGAIFNVSTVSGGFILGASQTLAGSGTVIGNTTISGTLTPGASPGTLTFEDALTLAGSTVMEIDGTAGAGVTGGHDFVNLTGAGAAGLLTYGGTMTLDIGTILGVGSYSWNLFDFASETGGFTGITLADQYSGSLTDAGGGVWGLTSGVNTWSFTESDGVLGLTVAIPEPRAALLGGLGLLMLLRRRR